MDGLEEADVAKTNATEKKRKQREEDAKADQEELDNWRKQEDEKFEQNLEKN